VENLDRETRLKIHNLEKEIQDLKVVIDTCQTALRSCDNVLKSDPKKHSEVFTTSAKWAMNFKL
jgi:hypothetical protein